MKIFLLGAIKRVFQPGCKFETMLCLVGGQGTGKSSFFRLLAVKDEWFSDDLRRLDDDNVYRKLQGHWIIEMSEMIATANAKSIEEIKSFLSKQKETYKVPYEKNQKREDVKSHHYIISFDPRDGTDNGLTVDRAQELGEQFCKEHFPGHQALVCTHPDGHNHSGNIHVHIVINSLRIYEVPLLPYMDRPADTREGCKHRCTNARSEERRVGKECRSRWSPYH